MKRQIRRELLSHSLISKSKYEQAVQGLFTTGTSEDCLLTGWPKKEKVSSKRGLKSIHHHSSRSGKSAVYQLFRVDCPFNHAAQMVT
jgi:hypothetical protein